MFFRVGANCYALEWFSETESARIRSAVKFCFDLYVWKKIQLFQKIFFVNSKISKFRKIFFAFSKIKKFKILCFFFNFENRLEIFKKMWVIATILENWNFCKRFLINISKNIKFDQIRTKIMVLILRWVLNQGVLCSARCSRSLRSLR